MENLQEILVSIEKKILILSKREEALKVVVEQKDKQILALQEQIKNLQNEVVDLKQKEDINKITNLINNHSDITECKLIINDLIRKINKSISILSSKES
ncbi:MAG: hypothetical protein MJZ71_05200 [Bacteroidales bacterium]|nr:hypothetical protein [Bacteroidales bacterium]